MGLFSRRKTSDPTASPTESPTRTLAEGGNGSSMGAPSDADSASSSSAGEGSSIGAGSERLNGPSVGPSRSGTKTSRKGKSGGFFGSSKHSGHREHIEVDPVILDARERIEAAEAAEIEADRALEQARLRVREARDYAMKIEEEAKAEARRAQLKAFHASEISKRGGQLGRHGE